MGITPNDNEQLEIVIIESGESFRALEEEWEELYQDSPLATPFQSWAWLYSWWEVYGEGRELRLVTVRNAQGLLVGVSPFVLDRRLGFSRLLFAGTGLTDYLDVLAREGWEGKVVDALAYALRQMISWQVANLQRLRPNAVAWGLCRRWDGPRLSVWQDGCPVVDVKPSDELLKPLSSNLRSTVRRSLRRAEAEGVRCELAGLDDAEEAARRLVSLHREAWQERDIGPEHLTNRFESHMVAAARRMTARGFGGISEFWRGGGVIISDFVVFGRDFLGTYLQGASRDALQHYQWSSLYIWDAINIARAKNVQQLDLLQGEEPYKLRWSSRVVSVHRLILCQRWTTWGLYGGYHILRSKARRYVLSECAPRWVKGAANTLRAMRRSVTRHIGGGNRT